MLRRHARGDVKWLMTRGGGVQERSLSGGEKVNIDECQCYLKTRDHQGNIVREEKRIKHRVWSSPTLLGKGEKEEPASDRGRGHCRGGKPGVQEAGTIRGRTCIQEEVSWSLSGSAEKPGEGGRPQD